MSMHSRLLATDLDGTFIGDQDSMFELWQDLRSQRISLVFSTGRHMDSIEDFYQLHDPVFPAHACVCMVGTEIWHLNGGVYERDEEWARFLSQGWDRRAVEDITGSVPHVVPQPDEWQSPLKASYFVDDGKGEAVAAVKEGLEEAGISAKVVYSGDRFLDVLPAGSGKGEAVAKVVASLGVTPDRVVTAGDSGNDLDMMRPDLGFRGIAVGNSRPELLSADLPNLYHARASFAAGVKEGLIHYGWIPQHAR